MPAVLEDRGRGSQKPAISHCTLNKKVYYHVFLAYEHNIMHSLIACLNAPFNCLCCLKAWVEEEQKVAISHCTCKIKGIFLSFKIFLANDVVYGDDIIII